MYRSRSAPLRYRPHLPTSYPQRPSPGKNTPHLNQRHHHQPPHSFPHPRVLYQSQTKPTQTFHTITLRALPPSTSHTSFRLEELHRTNYYHYQVTPPHYQKTFNSLTNNSPATTLTVQQQAITSTRAPPTYPHTTDTGTQTHLHIHPTQDSPLLPQHQLYLPLPLHTVAYSVHSFHHQETITSY